jgi:hypothetical protein
MVTPVLQDPRRHLLTVMVVALAGIVPLTYAFIQLMPFGNGSGLGAIVVWVLLGVAIAGLVAGVMMVLARATRLGELEHPSQDGDDDRAP